MKNKNLCPCCSGKTYAKCCEPYINGNKTPDTPEKLMRSRYTAYSKANIDYIQQSMCGQASVGFNAKEARIWARKANWLGLEVIKAPTPVLGKGFVEFIAKYYLDNKTHSIHELSEFHYMDDRWYYVNGVKS